MFDCSGFETTIVHFNPFMHVVSRRGKKKLRDLIIKHIVIQRKQLPLSS